MRTRITRRAVRSPLLAIALVAAFAGTAVATGATGFSATPLARGTLSTNVSFNAGEVKLQTKGDVDFVHSMVTIEPNGSSGWHTHPGIVLVTVASGSLTFSDDQCPGHRAPGRLIVRGVGRRPRPRAQPELVRDRDRLRHVPRPRRDDGAADRQAQPGLPAVLTAPSRTAGTFLRERPGFERFLHALTGRAASGRGTDLPNRFPAVGPAPGSCPPGEGVQELREAGTLPEERPRRARGGCQDCGQPGLGLSIRSTVVPTGTRYVA